MTSTIVRTLVLAAIVGLVAACAEVTPVAFTPIDDIQPGPGLFTGEDGEFTVYRR